MATTVTEPPQTHAGNPYPQTLETATLIGAIWCSLTGENGGRSAPGTVAVRGERERVRGRQEFLRERGEKELSEQKKRERTIKKEIK